MAWKAALLDLDGTLADSMALWLALPVETLRQAGLPEPPWLREALSSVPMWDLAERLAASCPQLGTTASLRELWYRRMEEHYRLRVSLKPGARALLALLRQRGLSLTVLSATREPLLSRALASLGLDALVDRAVSEEEAGSKGDGSAFLHCAGQLGLSCEELLLVEDAPGNLAAGRRLGLGAVGVYEATLDALQKQVRAASDVYLPDLRELSSLERWLDRPAPKT